MTALGIKKCEVFGCPHPAERMYQIAPATNVWMCQDCINAAEEGRTSGNLVEDIHGAGLSP